MQERWGKERTIKYYRTTWRRGRKINVMGTVRESDCRQSLHIKKGNADTFEQLQQL